MEPRTRRRRIWFALLFEGGLGVLALLLGWVFARNPLSDIRGSASGIAIGAAATLPLLGALLVVWRGRTRGLKQLRESVRRMVRSYFGRLTLPEAAALSAAAGIGEELLFRGLLQSGLTELLGLQWLAVVLSAVAFGAVHWHSRLYFLYATFLGAALGLTYALTGDLVAPILCHAAYDTVALMVSQPRAGSRPGFGPRVSPRRDRHRHGESADQH